MDMNGIYEWGVNMGFKKKARIQKVLRDAVRLAISNEDAAKEIVKILEEEEWRRNQECLKV